MFFIVEVIKPGQCPALNTTDFNSCTVECQVDQDCYGDAKCCSDNCTARCLRPVTLTGEYLPLIVVLFHVHRGGGAKLFLFVFWSLFQCFFLSPLLSVPHYAACQAQKAAAASAASVPGLFTPACESATGQYRQVQCSGQRCWCVDPVTGVEQSGTRTANGSLPNCSGKERSVKWPIRPMQIFCCLAF